MDSEDDAMHSAKTLLRGSTKLIHLFAIATGAAAVIIIAFSATAQSPTPASKSKVETTAAAVKVESPSGAELWAMNCNRCHMARNPGEFTAAQWRTIFRHMRIRANIPASQARELQKYLEAGAGK
jgi:cytochrome c553